MHLRQAGLLDLLVRSIQSSGWSVLVARSTKPFELRVYREGSPVIKLSIFIWNCTHGGGAARAEDEFRIQVTGAVPREREDAITLLLGWHAGYEVFVAWDIRRHDGQDSASPSAQVRENVLVQANSNRFAIGERGNGEVVVSFRPEFIVDYALVSQVLHRTGSTEGALDLLNDLPAIRDDGLFTVGNDDRRKVVSVIVRRYRAADFRIRVLGAYGHRCAMCGIQLELLDAAHILPVADESSSDETCNGVALCKTHHAAFDRNLVSFDEDYRIHISEFESNRLETVRRAGGLVEFRRGLKPALLLPSDRRDYPAARFISLARAARNWLP